VSYVNVVPSLQVSAVKTTVEWHERLFGRAPDRHPMDGCVEWQAPKSPCPLMGRPWLINDVAAS
jgi:hypothetical protein